MNQHAPLNEEARSPVEIVVTVPKPYAAALAVKARARMTLGALVQLIAGAERYVILSAPYIQEYESASELLYEALRGALRRGVDVDIVSTQAGLAAVARRDLGRRAKGRLRYYRPRANVLDETRLGSHAKLCVCDGAHAYIGSANLTAPGLSEHLEIGVLVHGQAAQQVETFWRLVFEEGLLVASEQV
jgi:phosphatidylserine/phosphatidylglycerophosphate/cardiolipin synthase-like enzyme